MEEQQTRRVTHVKVSLDLLNTALQFLDEAVHPSHSLREVRSLARALESEGQASVAEQLNAEKRDGA